MIPRYSFYWFILICCAFSESQVYAQQYLEFVENKGQWHSSIQFKGDLNTGAFALRPDGGYKMLLYNPEDIAKRNGMIHRPHSTDKNGGDNHVHQTANVTYNQIENNKVQTENLINGDVFVPVRGHVYEVKFLNANPNPTAIPDKVQDSYNNYFLGKDASKWASGCKIYAAVTYTNIYPNIDIRYYTDKGNLKYDFIIRPGGDYKKIAMYVEGANGIQQKNGQLIIKTSVDEVKENIPYTYQISGKGKVELKCDYVVKGNIVQFQIQEPVQQNQTLVIDPQLIFSTFSGSRSSNWGFTATYDGGGNFYAGGIVFGANFPISTGAFQTSYGGGNGVTGEGGGFDVGIMKFNPTGSNRIYATFLGGAGNDYPHSLVVDGSNNLIMAGKTTSANYPVNRTNFGVGGGMFDIILTKLNAAGTALIGSIVIGGSGDDGVNVRNKYPTGGSGVNANGAGSTRRNYGDDSRSEVIVDAIGNIYLASCTQSTDFPVTSNAFQPVNGGKNAAASIFQDGVVIKTSPNIDAVLMSSFLGGNRDDAAFVLALNPLNGNLFVAGGTQSADLPGNKLGVKFSTYQGGDCDGFVLELNNTLTSIVKSSYFGTDGSDVIYGIQFDRFGFPYILGTTSGTTNWIPTSNVRFSQAGGKQFIIKLKKDLSDYEYLTTFGTNATNPNISPTAFLVDRCENVYVSGWGGSGNEDAGYPSSGTNGLRITTDAYQRTTDGNDFYFFVLERNATSQLYGSFFGQSGGFGEHVDGGTSRFDSEGVIYQALCANCSGGGTFPVSGGAYSRVNAALGSVNGGCNLAAVKIAFNLAGVGSGVKSSIKGVANRRSGCVPLLVDFTDSLALGKQFIWNFGDGSPERTTTTPSIQHTYNAVGTYNVRLISIDSTTCNISDTSFVTIRVRNDEAFLNVSAIKVGDCNQLNYQFTNSSTAPVGKPFNSNSFNLVFGDGQSINLGSPQSVVHTYATPGTYNARLVLTDTNYCNTPDSITIRLRIAPLVKAAFKTSPAGCAPYNAVFENTSIAGTEFIWDFGDGTRFIGENPPPHLYSNIGTYTITLVANDTATCNKTDVTSFTITVNDKPSSSFTYAPQPPQANTPVVFTNTSSAGISYKWLFGDDDSLVTTNYNAFVSHIYNATKSYDASLIVTNAFGCRDTSTQEIRAIVFPLLDVPTAFTPNNDGKNDVIYVRGFGIEKLSWRIYNRWGVLMFETNNQKIGWDGKHKGVLQPQEVYTYSLDVTYSDGQRYTKTGDITLLR